MGSPAVENQQSETRAKFASAPGGAHRPVCDVGPVRVQVDGMSVKVWGQAAPIKHDNASQDSRLGQVSYHIRDAIRILVVVNIPWVVEKGGKRAIWAKLPEQLVGLWRRPFRDAVIFVQTRVKVEEKHCNLMNRNSHQLDEPGLECS